jgi:hypothetical protein
MLIRSGLDNIMLCNHGVINKRARESLIQLMVRVVNGWGAFFDKRYGFD